VARDRSSRSGDRSLWIVSHSGWITLSPDELPIRLSGLRIARSSIRTAGLTVAPCPLRLIPKDEGFFGLFDKLADAVVASSGLLHQLFAEPARLVHVAALIKDVEHTADQITHEIMQRIDRSFVTPLDREDIHALATSLDNVVDLMDGAARRAVVFDIRDCPPEAIGLAALLEQSASHIKDAVTGIKNPKLVFARMRDVKRIEEEGDALYARALTKLFSGTPDPIHVIKWKELLDNLEHALDEAEDVTNVLESISIKNN
jgi:predicted phosphate transport protein (TIGR00153 family)